jgi:phosphotransferase system enzyme I (PtsI)
MTIHLKGIGITRGIATGRAHILQHGLIEVQEYAIVSRYIPDEINRFKSALKTATSQLQKIKKQIPAHTPADITSFIDTHLLMLKDSALSVAPINIIQEQKCNAEWAVRQQRDILVQVFEDMEDAYLRTRKDDVDHVVNRILRALLSLSDNPTAGSDKRIKNAIILADDLSPADTVVLLHQGIAGFVTEHGGPTSHTAIIARGLGIPAIVGLHNVQRYIKEDEEIIIDGSHGIVVAEIDEQIRKQYRRLQREERKQLSALAKLKDKPAITRDGKKIHLLANIELPEDVNSVKRMSVGGVGLYRTEFLYMNRSDTPGEDEQLKAYLRVVKALKGAPLTIRTLDLGADKQVDGGPQNRPVSINPALGLRAVRLCLKNPDLFLPQLRAILRAAAHGPVRMLIPMLSNLSELQQVLDMVEEAKWELKRTRKKYNPDVPIGAMIEVPAAALAANNLAKNLDFLSIGTNDLIQYTLAIDRIDDEVNYLYDPAHPSVLNLIRQVIDAGKKNGIPVSMCGEMAGDTRYTRLLLGLGLREFSMHPANLLEVKQIINHSEYKQLKTTYTRLVKRGDPRAIHAQLEKDQELR